MSKAKRVSKANKAPRRHRPDHCRDGSLSEVLPYMKFVAAGISSKPTIEVSSANVQIVSGAGSQSALNGLGDFVIGENETPGIQTGSNGLVLGGEAAFPSYGGVVAGIGNTIEGPYASVPRRHSNVARTMGKRDRRLRQLSGRWNCSHRSLFRSGRAILGATATMRSASSQR